jgi:protein-tyrosine phosphatase
LKTKNSKLKTKNYAALTDYHCHILPGLDDGAGTLDEAVEMARILAGFGFAEVCCTPHCIRGCYDNTPAGVQRGVAALQAALDGAGIALRLQPGMEYYLDEYFPAHLDHIQPLGNSRMVLVEAPSQSDPDLIKDHVFQVVRRGFTPLLAHPERYGFLSARAEEEGLWGRAKRFITQNSKQKTQNSSDIDDFQNIGCKLQGNIGSFAGYYGPGVCKKAWAFQAGGYYNCLGSDGHHPDPLARILSKGIAALKSSGNFVESVFELQINEC